MECTGYWESCSCKECQEVKELYLDRDWFWDNEEMESLMQSIGYESLEVAAKDAEEILKLIGGAENA